MPDRTYCRDCDCNPCMCGRRDYMTEGEKHRRNREDYTKRWKDDAWAIPPWENNDDKDNR